jgi:hypothetical protein
MVNHPYHHTEETKEKLRQQKLWDKNPKWKGGNSYRCYMKEYIPIMKSLEQKCSMCGSTEKLITHHIDGNYKHNELSNITIVCRGCHNKIHKSKRLLV